MSAGNVLAERQKEKGFSSMVVSLMPDGRIIVQDYSPQDDRHKFIRLLQEMGIETTTIFDSPCG